MPHKKDLTLIDVLDAYYADCRVVGLKESTIRGYQRSLRCFLRWAEQSAVTHVRHFTAENVKRYIAYVQARPKWADNAYVPTRDELVSATTVRNYVRDLKAFASWLEREGYTAENALMSVRKPKADEVPIEPFDRQELDAIFAAFDLADTVQYRDYVLLHTLWDTGMRVGELVALTLDDVDLKACEIRIRHAKWGKWRDIGFGMQTQKQLTRYLAVCRPGPAQEDERHFLLSVDGYPLTTNAVEHVCARLSRRLGFRIHPHRFRHTFAVSMLRNGADIRTLQKLMGHASVQILLRYLNLASGEAIEAHRVNSPADRHHAQRRPERLRFPIQRYRQLNHDDGLASR